MDLQVRVGDRLDLRPTAVLSRVKELSSPIEDKELPRGKGNGLQASGQSEFSSRHPVKDFHLSGAKSVRDKFEEQLIHVIVEKRLQVMGWKRRGSVGKGSEIEGSKRKGSFEGWYYQRRRWFGSLPH